MNENLKKRINEKAKTARIMNNHQNNNLKRTVSIKEDVFQLEKLSKNEKQVLLPLRTSQLDNTTPTIACLLIPSLPTSTRRIQLNIPRFSISTHRKYHSAHIEIPSKKTISAQKSERFGPQKERTRTKQLNCKGHTFFTLKIHERIPRLQKKNWNSFHQNKIRNNRMSNPNLKKIKLRSLKQQENIISKSKGVLTLKMQCIPFSVWNRNKKNLFAEKEKQRPSKGQYYNIKLQKNNGQNEDKLKRLQLLSRENNLRKKILMSVLQGNPYGSQTERPFICYFPHTDYDLALKEYIKRHQELEGRTRFLSLCTNNDDARLEKTEHLAYRRESCVNFTQFNRQRYDIKMGRADLIKAILQKKETEQITGKFDKQIRGKIEKLIISIKQQSSSISSRKQLRLQRSNSKQSFRQLMKEINLAQKNKGIIRFSQQKMDLSRLSKIFPIQSQRRDSQLKVFSDLIESLKEKSTYQINRNSIESESLIKQVSSDQAQDSLRISDKIQNKTKRNNQGQETKLENGQIYMKNRVTKQREQQQQNKSKTAAFKPPAKVIANTSISAFKRQIIQKKVDLHIIERKEQKLKSNDLKKVSKQEIKKRVQKIIKQQKTIQFSNAPIQLKQVNEQSYLSLKTNIENIPINSQSMHIIPTTIDITEASRSLVRIPSNYIKAAVIQCQGQSKMTVIQISKQFTQIQKVQPSIWQLFRQKINTALRIIRWASEEFYQKILARSIYFIRGEWIVFTILHSPQSQQQNYATGLLFLSNQKLQISIDMITLQLMLKVMAGQRIILFKNKPKVEDEVNYHCSKGHFIYLLPRNLQAIQSNYQLSTQHNYKCLLQAKKTTPFDWIISQYQLISINNRIKNTNLFRNHLQANVSGYQTKQIFLNASLPTVGTITIYFPFYKSDFYVELLMKKKTTDRQTGQKVLKQIGRVRQKVKYDNIYFQFTIKGEYSLEITVENDNQCHLKICSESNRQIRLNAK